MELIILYWSFQVNGRFVCNHYFILINKFETVGVIGYRITESKRYELFKVVHLESESVNNLQEMRFTWREVLDENVIFD